MTQIVADLASLAFPVDRLDPLPGNPRRGDVDAVAKSYAAFGQRKPIVARRSEGQRGCVIAGNHQLAAAQKLGWSEIAVVWVDDDADMAAAFALADNRTAELGSYDDEALLALIQSVEDDELMAATGWSNDAVQELLNRLAVPVSHTDPDAVPSLPTRLVTRRGDVWRLGPHRLVCGDATSDLPALMGNEIADLVWTDPPYGVAYVGKTRSALRIKNDRLSIGNLTELLRLALGEALRFCRPGASWFVAAPGGPEFLAFATVLAELKVWRQTILWVKDRFVLGHSDYHWRHEPLLYGWAEGEHTLPPEVDYEETAELLLTGWAKGAAHAGPPNRKQDTVWQFPRPSASREHPTMKPVALIERAIRNHSAAGALILDPFGGSGSTLIAAHVSGRVARLMDLDPGYCDVICRRYQEHTGEKPVLETTGKPYDFTADS